MPQQPIRIACIGEAMVELSGLDAAAGTLNFGVAGDTLNTAIYLSRANVPNLLLEGTQLLKRRRCLA